MLDHLEGRTSFEVVEREDRWIGFSLGPPAYFADFDGWPDIEQKAIGHARGRVLDIGCGAGRHALYLQKQGCDVLGIDISPKAIEVCKRRGLKRAEVKSITELNAGVGTFDTILMLGNNFGLFSNFKRAHWLLRRFYKMTSPDACIIAESRDPYTTDDPDHLRYHKRNMERGRMGGQIRLRVRYKSLITPWFDYLMVSQNEMKEILKGTGWHIRNFFNGESAFYAALIEKDV